MRYLHPPTSEDYLYMVTCVVAAMTWAYVIGSAVEKVTG